MKSLKYNVVAVAALAIAASFPVSAHDLSLSLNVNDLPVSQVATYRSMAGESLTSFVKRVAPELESYTDRTGHEICGLIAVTNEENDGNIDGAFSLVAGTIGSQIACTAAIVEPGYTSLDRTIHTHPIKRRIKLTALDMKARGTPAGKLRMENVDNCKFSSMDYTNPGYLVACGKIFYQNGRRGSEHEIK